VTKALQRLGNVLLKRDRCEVSFPFLAFDLTLLSVPLNGAMATLKILSACLSTRSLSSSSCTLVSEDAAPWLMTIRLPPDPTLLLLCCKAKKTSVCIRMVLAYS